MIINGQVPFVPYKCTLSWRTILVEDWSTELYHISFFQIFLVELEYITFKMIHWAKMKGRQFLGTTGQALPPVSAVTREDSNLSLLPKQVGRLGLWCSKAVCPPFSPSGLIQWLWIMILHKTCRKMVYHIFQFINFEPKLYSGLVWINKRPCINFNIFAT